MYINRKKFSLKKKESLSWLSKGRPFKRFELFNKQPLTGINNKKYTSSNENDKKLKFPGPLLSSIQWICM